MGRSIGEHDIVPVQPGSDIGKCTKCGAVEPQLNTCEEYDNRDERRKVIG